MRVMGKAFLAVLLSGLIGCSDSDTINSIVEAEITVPAEAYVITSDGFKVVNLVDPKTNDSLADPTTKAYEGLTHLLHLDTDLSKNRQITEDYPNDRGVEAEYFVYSKAETPGKLFLFDLSTRVEFELFDFSDTRVKSTNGQICALYNNSQPDLEKIKNNAFEIKQELTLYSIVGEDNCTGEMQTYKVTIEEDTETTFKRRIYEASSEEGSEEDVTYTLVETEFTSFLANRESVSPALASEQHRAVAIENVNTYGLLRFSEPANGSTDVIEVTFYRPLNDDTTELYSDWRQDLTHSNISPEEIELIFNDTLESSFLSFILTDDLIKLNKADIFDTPAYTDRSDSLDTPIYTWSTDATAQDKEHILQLNDGSLALFDNQKLKLISTNGVESLVKDFASPDQGLDSVQLVESDSELIVLKKKNDQFGMSFVTLPGGVENTIASFVDKLITYPFRTNFDYYLNDPGSSIDARFAQFHSGGTPQLTPALIHTAWLNMKNYLNNATEQLILASSESNDGILKAPNIYVFDELEDQGQGELLGSFVDNIATVEEAIIVNEKFGMIWVKDSFAADAQTKAYYFKPTETPWEFTLVDTGDDTAGSLLPAWLPSIGS